MAGDIRLAVLLIEDQAAEVDLIGEMLAQVPGIEFHLVHFERLAKGLDHLRHESVDLVLLDLGLPDSTGYETFRRAFHAVPSVPIILLTNNNDEAEALRAVRQGAQDYLIKRYLDSNLLTRSIRCALERQRAESTLRQRQERCALALMGSNDGVWDWNIGTGEVYYSARWQNILGFAEGEIEGVIEAWNERVHPEDAPDFQHELKNHLAGSSPRFSCDYRLRAKDGSYLWVSSRGIKALGENGKPVRMAGALTDISARKYLEEQLLHDALHDSLTGLPNRNLFLDRLNRAVSRLKRRDYRKFGVMFIDLDRFKEINDNLGHAAGDHLLVIIGEILSSAIRTDDTVARIGGDEFAILIDDVHTQAHATHVAQRILDNCSRCMDIEGHELVVTVSIGIAFGNSRYKDANEILRDADSALYEAKSKGKACYQVFDRTMHRRAESDLTRADGHRLSDAAKASHFSSSWRSQECVSKPQSRSV